MASHDSMRRGEDTVVAPSRSRTGGVGHANGGGGGWQASGTMTHSMSTRGQNPTSTRPKLTVNTNLDFISAPRKQQVPRVDSNGISPFGVNPSTCSAEDPKHFTELPQPQSPLLLSGYKTAGSPLYIPEWGVRYMEALCPPSYSDDGGIRAQVEEEQLLDTVRKP